MSQPQKPRIRRLIAAVLLGFAILLPGVLSSLIGGSAWSGFGPKAAISQSDGLTPTPSPSPPSCGGSIRLGERKTDQIPWIGGSCTYSLQGRSDQIVTITMEDTDGILDAYLELWDPAGNLVNADDDGAGNTDSRISAQRLPANGTYRVVARTYNNEGQGAFLLTVTVSDSSAPTPTPIPTPSPSPPSCGGSIRLGERKTDRIPWIGGSCTYSLQGRSDQIVTITMEDTDGILDAYLELWDPAGNLVNADDDGAGNTDSRISAQRLPANGTYRVVARTYNNEGQGTFLLTVTVSDSSAPTPTPIPAPSPSPPSCGGSIDLEERKTGRIPWIGGSCRYSLTGTEGTFLTIRMQATGANMDSYLELLDSAGNVLIADDDSGGNGNSLINGYRLPRSGAYVIVARTYNNEGSGSFMLSVSPATTAALTTPTTVTDNANLLTHITRSMNNSAVRNTYPAEATLFAHSLLTHLGDFPAGNQNVSVQSVQAALGSSDVGDRINSIVNQVWSDWRAFSIDHMQADPAQNGQSRFRQVVIRLIQNRQSSLSATDQIAIYSFLTRAEDAATWRENARSVIGAINREVYGQ